MARDQQLMVVVSRVTHRKADSGWCILDTDQGVCKGVVSWEPREGERLKLVGYWQLSKFSGKQEFTFASAMLDMEMDPRALLHYAVAQTSGLGEAKETAIWDAYGEAWQDDPELLLVDGLTRYARDNWRTTLATLKDFTAQMQATTWLLAHGCTDKLAAAAWSAWREKTIGIVEHDPYRLAELPGRGWSEIDTRVARPHFGIAVDDPRRVDAGVLYAMGQSDGDTLQPERFVVGRCIQIGLDPELVPAALTRLEDNEDGGDPRVWRFRGPHPEAALYEDYKHETAIWQRFGKRGVA